MYPGLIDSLLKQYGSSGHNHPKYQEIKGRPTSTPTLNALAKAGMRFTQANPEWNFCRLQDVMSKDSFLASPTKTNGQAQTEEPLGPDWVAALDD
jgi:hypothetical protein